MISTQEQSRIKNMTDDQLYRAITAMASTLGQRINNAQRKRAMEYKQALIKELNNRK